ncbi:MAG: glycosyltransferase family 2 protein [Pseudomonadota bacterium]
MDSAQPQEAEAGPAIDRPDRPMLSLVVPAFNEEQSLPDFFPKVTAVLETITDRFEIICVDDGSLDNTAALLHLAHQRDPRIKMLRLSRNFGKEVALTAGLHAATGDAVIPIDADLQDPPDLIADMVAKWREGAKMVVAVRSDRSSDTRMKRMTANAFYRVIRGIGEIPIPDNAGDFRLMDRVVVDALKSLPERTRFNKGLFAWLGFQQTVITYQRPARMAGTSKWPYWRLWNFALEGIFSFSTVPLRIWTYLGAVVAIGAIAYAILIVVRTLLYGIDVPGYASLATMQLLFSGLIMIGMGIIGEYLGRVFIEVKARPLYLVEDSLGFDPPAASRPASPARDPVGDNAPSQAV